MIQFSISETSCFLFTLTDCFCLLWQMKSIGVPDFPVGLFLGKPTNRPAFLQALLPCMCPGNGLDHLCLCLSHIPCGFMCHHINMEQQRFMDKFLAAGRNRSNNQKWDLQSKTFLSVHDQIWTLLNYYICIYAHQWVGVCMKWHTSTWCLYTRFDFLAGCICCKCRHSANCNQLRL